MVLQTPQKRTPTLVTWEKLPEDFVLPDDPVENIPLLSNWGETLISRGL